MKDYGQYPEENPLKVNPVDKISVYEMIVD